MREGPPQWNRSENLTAQRDAERLADIKKRGFQSKKEAGDKATRVVFEEENKSRLGVIYEISNRGFIKIEVVVGREPGTKKPIKEVLKKIFEPEELTIASGNPLFNRVKTL